MNRLEVYRFLRQSWRFVKRLGLERVPLISQFRHKLNGKMLKWIAPEGFMKVKSKALGNVELQVDPTFFNFCDQRDYEAFNAEVFSRVLKPGDTVIDIGANAGYFSLLAAKAVGPNGKVYAFEPSSTTFPFLRNNVESNGFGGVISPIKKAVSSSTGALEFYNYEQATGAGSLHRNDNITNFKVSSIEKVECVSIDDFIGDRPVDVVKIDVEGHEPSALAGMAKTISRNPSLVIFSEVHPGLLASAGSSADEYLGTFTSLGFSISVIDEDTGALHPLSADVLEKLRRSETTDSIPINVLCTRGDVPNLKAYIR